MKDLAVNGKDLMSVGFSEGIEIGITLKYLLDDVIDGKIKNKKTVLLKEAEKYLHAKI